MKNKNILLTVSVALAALSSSFASIHFAVTATWISGTKFVNPTTSVSTCSTLGSVCTAIGTTPNCQISVTLRDGTTKPTIAYSDATCTIPLKANAVYNYVPPITSFLDVRTYTPIRRLPQ